MASNLRNMVVYSKNMVKLGKVKDLEVNTGEMKLTHLILELEKQAAKELLGKRIVIHHGKGRVSTTLIENIKDAIILSQPTTGLKGAIEST